MQEKIWGLLNSKISLTVIGFLCTTVLADWLNTQYQSLAWLGKKQFEIMERTLTKQEEFMTDLITVMDNRSFWLQKVFWALEDQNEPAHIKQLWRDEYYPTVIDWNESLTRNLYHMRMLTRGTHHDINSKFYTNEDDVSYQEPETVHGHYKSAHYLVRNMACCEGIADFCSENFDVKQCPASIDNIKLKAETSIQQLVATNTNFLVELQRTFDVSNEQFESLN